MYVPDPSLSMGDQCKHPALCTQQSELCNLAVNTLHLYVRLTEMLARNFPDISVL